MVAQSRREDRRRHAATAAEGKECCSGGREGFLKTLDLADVRSFFVSDEGVLVCHPGCFVRWQTKDLREHEW